MVASGGHSTWQGASPVEETKVTSFTSARARGSVVERPIRIIPLELKVVIWEGPGFDSRRVQFFILCLRSMSTNPHLLIC